MTKLSDLATPAMRERIANALSFTIEPEPMMEGERPEKFVRIPAFDIGQRVIVAPTPGSPDPAIRKGGPGTVCHIKEVVAGVVPRKDTMIYVIVDDAQDAKAEPYHACELQPEPTV